MRLRVSVVGLFISEAAEVLVLDQATPPEPGRWDLPGGGLDPTESLLDGLRREIREETGLDDFRVGDLVTLHEAIYPELALHTLSVVYRCWLADHPTRFSPQDTEEIGPRGIQWLAIASLSPDLCTSRTWAAVQALPL